MVGMKHCPRCNGTMMLEEFPGDVEFACLQCGHRIDAPEFRKPTYAVAQPKKAA